MDTEIIRMNIGIDEIKSDQPPISETKLSEIQSFYRGSTVFLTGATGFIGHLVLENLLRKCSGVKRIYILIREKRAIAVEGRIKAIFSNELFEKLKQEQPHFSEKVSAITGDCSLPNLGIDNKLLDILKNEVNVVIHGAATIKFDEPLGKAANINVFAVQDLLKLCKKMKNLKSYVHISTAYSNCNSERKVLNETFYKPHITGDELKEFMSNHNNNQMSDATPRLLKNYPNTYTMTKSIAEYELLIKGEGLPIGIVRPSIVIGTEHDPIPGWNNNIYGPTGINASISLGLLRCMRANPESIADMIPGDYVSNAIVTCAWDIHQKWKENKNVYKTVVNEAYNSVEKSFIPPIYNITSSKKNPITWGRFNELRKEQEPHVISNKAIYLSSCTLYQDKTTFVILWFLLHTIPGFVIDVCAKLSNNKSPKLMDKCDKLYKAIDVLKYFTLNSWIFQDNNIASLLDRLSEQDKSLFEFDTAKINWNTYVKSYMIGIRTYIIKDPIETIPEGLKHRKKLLNIHYTLLAVFSAMLVFMLYGFILLVNNINTQFNLLSNLYKLKQTMK